MLFLALSVFISGFLYYFQGNILNTTVQDIPGGNI